MRLIGIDYGEKRVGIALSDLSGTIATPFVVLKNDKKLTDNVSVIVRDEGAKGVVLGASYNFQGKENPIMNDIQKLGGKLEEILHIPVYYENEMLTSVQARRHETNPELRDASAAALILQSYLDNHDFN